MPVSQPNADVRGEEACLKYGEAFKSLFEPPVLLKVVL